MSEYGPAIFIARRDGNEIPEEEQQQLKALIEAYAEQEGLTEPADGSPVEPRRYDYDEYEEKAVSFVMWADYAFAAAPEFIQEDMNTDAEELASEVGEFIDARHPDTYEYQGYMVEC